MKLNAEKVDIETSGFKSKGFSIDVNDPAIMQIITEQIYNDGYVWPRELIANANDAGGAVDLKLPDDLDLDWVIEDHGPGMTDEFMENRYTAIFSSTKRDDNTKTGGFGHGRLSPLAYTDSFSVRSRYMHEGKVLEGNYVVFRGENKIPEIARLSLGISDVQQTGVRVSVPCAAKDFAKIVQRTKYYAQYQVPTPPEIKPIDYLFVAPGIGGIRKDTSRKGNRYGDSSNEFQGGRFIMAGVPYPIPDAFDGSGYNLDLFAEGGQLNPTLSRDAIRGDDSARALATKQYKALRAAYSKHVQDGMDAKPSILDKIIFYQEQSKIGESYTVREMMRDVSAPTALEAQKLFDVTKKDFAFHTFTSDVNRSSWEGMDNTTKTYKSLNVLKVFMLTGKGNWQRREGVATIEEKQIALRQFIPSNYYDTSQLTAEDFKKKMVVFAVPLPYGNGQIKRIRTAIADTLGKLRDAGTVNNSVGIVLVQYEDKTEVKKMMDLITTAIDIHYIDESAASATLQKYYPTLARIDGRFTARAMTGNQLNALVKPLLLPRLNKSEYTIQSILNTASTFIPNRPIVCMSEGDIKRSGFVGEDLKTAVLAAISTTYGYPYDTAKLAENRDANNNIRYEVDNNLFKAVWPKSSVANTTLALTLLADPRIQALPTLKAGLEARETLLKVKDSTDYQKIFTASQNIHSLESNGLITKAELPAPTKAFPLTNYDAEKKLVAAIDEKYPLLTEISARRNFSYMPKPEAKVFYENLVNFFVKLN